MGATLFLHPTEAYAQSSNICMNPRHYLDLPPRKMSRIMAHLTVSEVIGPSSLATYCRERERETHIYIYVHIYIYDVGLAKRLGVLFGGLNPEYHGILGCMLGTSHFWQLPDS